MTGFLTVRVGVDDYRANLAIDHANLQHGDVIADPDGGIVTTNVIVASTITITELQTPVPHGI